ncbi:MAG: hypothetical protein ACPGUE_14740 [Marinomonas sp.]
MKPNQRVKGYKLVAGQEYDIEETFKAPIVAIQNQGGAVTTITLNDGEPMNFDATPFAWEPFVPLLGKIVTAGDSVVVWA